MSGISAVGGASAQVQQAMAVAAQVMSQNTQELAASLINQTLAEMNRMAQAQASGKGLNLDVTV
jgi:conjugal transfer/entry exclusion protein